MVGPSCGAEQLAHSIEGVLRSLRQAELVLTMECLEYSLSRGISLLERVIAARRAKRADTGHRPPLWIQLQGMSAGASHHTSSAVPLRINPRKTEEGKGNGTARTWAVEFTPTPELARRRH